MTARWTIAHLRRTCATPDLTPQQYGRHRPRHSHRYAVTTSARSSTSAPPSPWTSWPSWQWSNPNLDSTRQPWCIQLVRPPTMRLLLSLICMQQPSTTHEPDLPAIGVGSATRELSFMLRWNAALCPARIHIQQRNSGYVYNAMLSTYEKKTMFFLSQNKEVPQINKFHITQILGSLCAM